jgi:NADH-quinone oxidoreductase subunit E
MIYLQSWILLLLAFAVGAWIGWRLRGPAPRVAFAEAIPAAPISPPVRAATIPPVRTVEPRAFSIPPVSPLAYRPAAEVETLVIAAQPGAAPLLLDGPRGQADDLKKITGVGPSNESELHNLGVYHFWQIASWTAPEVAWVAHHIEFGTRIAQENWMDQAARLARGEETPGSRAYEAGRQK